jgi:hypothetical protein
MTLCSLCGEQMMVMPGPEEGEVTYDHQSKRVYHKQCLEEYKEFVAYYTLGYVGVGIGCVDGTKMEG